MSFDIEPLKYVAVYLCVAGLLLGMLVLFALKTPMLPSFRKPPEELVDRTRLLLEEIRFELTTPLAAVEFLARPIPAQMDKLNFLATHLRKYIEQRVLEYMEDCSYVSKSTWLRKPRVVTEVNDGQIYITVYGLNDVIIHTINFMPTEFAHATVYFKNKVY